MKVRKAKNKIMEGFNAVAQKLNDTMAAITGNVENCVERALYEFCARCERQSREWSAENYTTVDYGSACSPGFDGHVVCMHVDTDVKSWSSS